MPNVMEYKCPCCGGVVEFDSTIQQMKCPYCDTVFKVADMLGKDDVLETPQPEPTPDPSLEGMGVYTCRSCGGELVADENTAATHCPFCGNPVMLTGRLSGEWKPDLVLPFQKTKEDAKEALRGFTKGKKLVPRLFQSENHIDEIKGVYVPFWLYDVRADGQARYEATNRRSWREGDYEVTETKYYDVERVGTLDFDNVPVDASDKMPAELTEAIEPYDFSALKPFQTAYLSGYLADKYDVNSEQSFDRAAQRVRASTEQALRDTVSGYHSVHSVGNDVQLDKAPPKYALLPVWMLTTTWHDRKYTFAMNGQTGKFVGTLPIDKGAWWKWFLIYGGAFSAVLWLVVHFLFKL